MELIEMLNSLGFNSIQQPQKSSLSFGIKTKDLKEIINNNNLKIDVDVLEVPRSIHYHYPKATLVSGYLMAGKENVKEKISNYIICAHGKGKNLKKALKKLYNKMAESITSGCALVKGKDNELITYA